LLIALKGCAILLNCVPLLSNNFDVGLRCAPIGSVASLLFGHFAEISEERHNLRASATQELVRVFLARFLAAVADLSCRFVRVSILTTLMLTLLSNPPLH
jgi:hypothetical protein